MNLTIQQPGPATTAGNITFADVLRAIPSGEDGQPQPFAKGVGATSIREFLGRGSFETITKHFTEIRRQINAASIPAVASTTPPAPPEAVAAVWTVAWSMAQSSMLARLDSMTAERDGLSTLASAQAADLQAFGAEVDALRDAAATAAQANVQSKAQAQSELDLIRGQLDALRVQLEGERTANASTVSGLRSELDRVQAAAANAAELAEANWKIERQLLGNEVSSLLERVSELRALEIWAAMYSKSILPGVQSAPGPV